MVTISLCMIVRDEASVLARCLDSLQAVTDEIIIVDTGSVDDTRTIAARYTDRIYDFTWIDDFSAARNYSFSKATMDYCMWADADDVLPETEREKLLHWKTQTTFADAPDILMLKYATAFAANGAPTFQYYRERLLRRERQFRWKGRVHEAIAPAGRLQYSDIYLEHRSIKASYSDRNLKIYEKLRTDGELCEARDWFYYARELYYHRYYTAATDAFSRFLSLPHAFVENQVEACRIRAYCLYALNEPSQALSSLLQGLIYRVPSGELCCDIGKHFLDRADYEQAIFWYLAALHAPKKTETGGFITEECYDYLPCLQLSVCYDRMGQITDALRYHKAAGIYNPTGELYLQNQTYFARKEKELREGTIS